MHLRRSIPPAKARDSGSHAAPWRGFHSFRRTLGTKLVQEETPLDVVQQILGHSHMDSMQPYPCIDELGLRECAIGLISERKAGT